MLPQPSDHPGQDCCRAEECQKHDECARHASSPLPNYDDHHHVRPGRDLPHAVQVNELNETQPLVHVDGQVPHLRKRGQAAAHRQDRQIREYADEGEELVHETLSLVLRGRYQKMAMRPTTTSTRGTDW